MDKLGCELFGDVSEMLVCKKLLSGLAGLYMVRLTFSTDPNEPEGGW